jgi:hypothetical protein
VETRRVTATVAAVAALAVTAACSSPSHPRAPGVSASPLIITSAAPITRTLASRVVAKIPIDNPDGLTELGGAIWVKTDDGRAVRVDPRRNKVTVSIKLDTATERHHYCQGVGSDGTSVWACAATDTTTNLVRIDPAELRVRTTAAADKAFDQLTLPHTSSGFWVLSGAGRTISLVTPTGSVTSYPLPDHCLQVAARDQLVITTCAPDNEVLSIDPTSGSVRARLHLSAPRLALVTDDDVWVDTSDGLTRLSHDLTRRAVFPNQYAGLDGDLASFGNDLWVRGPAGVLWLIDQAHNQVTEKITTDQPIRGGSLLATADALWFTEGDEGFLLRLSR